MTTSARVRSWTDRILSNEFFGEEVIYTPAGGQPVTISAYVYRRKSVELKDFSNRSFTTSQMQYDIEIRVNRDDVATVTKKMDSVALPLNLGETNTTFRVADILSQDIGSYRLGLSI